MSSKRRVRDRLLGLSVASAFAGSGYAAHGLLVRQFPGAYTLQGTTTIDADTPFYLPRYHHKFHPAMKLLIQPTAQSDRLRLRLETKGHVVEVDGFVQNDTVVVLPPGQVAPHTIAEEWGTAQLQGTLRQGIVTRSREALTLLADWQVAGTASIPIIGNIKVHGTMRNEASGVRR